jgi:hypothetical protein
MARRMSEATFRLAYDGDAVRHGEMDVADLAPALLGMAQLLKAAARVVQGDDAEISVRVKTTRDACFEVLLNLIVHDGAAGWAFLKTPDGQAAGVLLTLLGVSAKSGIGGAIGVVRWLKGRWPRSRPVGGGDVSLMIDEIEIVVPDTLARLALDPGVRGALEKIIYEPLEKDGIESVSLGEASSAQTITKEESGFFRAISNEDADEFASRHTKAFSISTLSFKKGQRWRLSDGASPRSVTMADADFLARVDSSQESFDKGDILVCEVVERARRTANGFKSDYEITKVIEHRKFQPPAPFHFYDSEF